MVSSSPVTSRPKTGQRTQDYRKAEKSLPERARGGGGCSSVACLRYLTIDNPSPSRRRTGKIRWGGQTNLNNGRVPKSVRLTYRNHMYNPACGQTCGGNRRKSATISVHLSIVQTHVVRNPGILPDSPLAQKYRPDLRSTKLARAGGGGIVNTTPVTKRSLRNPNHGKVTKGRKPGDTTQQPPYEGVSSVAPKPRKITHERRRRCSSNEQAVRQEQRGPMRTKQAAISRSTVITSA